MAPRIRCFYEDCTFVAAGFCSTSSVELDPEDGCLSYTENLGGDAFALNADGGDFSDDDWDDAGFEEIDELDIDEDY